MARGTEQGASSAGDKGDVGLFQAHQRVITLIAPAPRHGRFVPQRVIQVMSFFPGDCGQLPVFLQQSGNGIVAEPALFDQTPRLHQHYAARHDMLGSSRRCRGYLGRGSQMHVALFGMQKMLEQPGMVAVAVFFDMISQMADERPTGPVNNLFVAEGRHFSSIFYSGITQVALRGTTAGHYLKNNALKPSATGGILPTKETPWTLPPALVSFFPVQQLSQANATFVFRRTYSARHALILATALVMGIRLS